MIVAYIAALASGLFAALPVARAAETSTNVTFTFMSLAGGSVVTTSTTYLAVVTPPPPPKGTPSSFQINSSALAYPTFPNVSLAQATSAPRNGTPSAQQLLLEAAQLFEFKQVADESNCATCQRALASVASRVRVQQETLDFIAQPFCNALSGTGLITTPICMGLFKVASTDFGGLLPAMDLLGDDGQLLCAYMFGLCQLPPVPQLNFTALFKNTTKPASKPLAPSGQEPLKVLHFSDYHLDLRYVVGAEANCNDGKVCCRVYPYTNMSAPIQAPASLFGNYECDTPQTLGKSVFTAVPNVTGFDWCEYSFGLFTGDLVSHDLWELTKPYVEQVEMEAYQEFFDGMGGVPLYPTLGNHDTFPQAFTAFPNQDDKLPFNASYPVQQQWNYELASHAWANYEWLTEEEAQAVINTGLGIYRAVTKEGLVIISLNSDVWYYFNLYAYIGGNMGDNTGMFKILIDYLLEAEECGQPVWLIQHVNTGGSGDYEALPAASDLWYAIVDRFNATIRGTFFGHTHADEFSVVYANNATVQTAENAAAMAWIMPSVTPYQNFNAGFRYYLVDPVTFQIMDSITYFANISDTVHWQETGDVEWQFEYSARQTYNYDGRWPDDQPLTAEFWHSVAIDIANNETTFQTYTDLRTKKIRPYAAPTDASRNLTLCGLMSMSVPIFERCLNTMNSTTSFL